MKDPYASEKRNWPRKRKIMNMLSPKKPSLESSLKVNTWKFQSNFASNYGSYGLKAMGLKVTSRQIEVLEKLL